MEQNLTANWLNRLTFKSQCNKIFNKCEKMSLRIITANFNGNPIMTVISCYSPTNVSDEADVTEFYNNMSSFTRLYQNIMF